MTLELVPWRGHTVPLVGGARGDEIQRYTTQDYINWLTSNYRWMAGGQPAPLLQTTYGDRAAEPISNSYEGYASGMLMADGPVAAAQSYRLRVFGQAPLLYQRMADGRPGDLFDDDKLSRLRAPWAGANQGDLMKRALLYGDLAGNAFVLDMGDELVLVRPDWVEIVLQKREYRGGQVGWRQIGILYYEGGLRASVGVPFPPGEYCHFVPGLPDPLATYRGMSWLTPLVREVQADKAAMDHKVAFFEHAATPNLAVSLPKEITPQQFGAFVDRMDEQHRGALNAGKTLYTAGGADVTVIGANMRDVDFSAVVGKGETRVANAAGVPPTLLSFSEGMQGSSLNSGNYVAAKRNFVDTTMRDLWGNWCGSIALMDAFIPPKSARLWYDHRDIPFLHEDQKDAAEIQEIKARTIGIYVMNGFKPDSAVKSVDADDRKLLEHTGLVSVQLLPPGQEAGQGGDGSDALGPGYQLDDSGSGDDEPAMRALPPWDDTADIWRMAGWNPKLHPRWPKGTPFGGKFMSKDDLAFFKKAGILDELVDASPETVAKILDRPDVKVHIAHKAATAAGKAKVAKKAPTVAPPASGGAPKKKVTTKPVLDPPFLNTDKGISVYVDGVHVGNAYRHKDTGKWYAFTYGSTPPPQPDEGSTRVGAIKTLVDHYEMTGAEVPEVPDIIFSLGDEPPKSPKQGLLDTDVAGVTLEEKPWPSPGIKHLAVTHNGVDVGHMATDPDGDWVAWPPTGAEYGLSGAAGSGEIFATKDAAIKALVDAHAAHGAAPAKLATPATPATPSDGPVVLHPVGPGLFDGAVEAYSVDKGDGPGAGFIFKNAAGSWTAQGVDPTDGYYSVDGLEKDEAVELVAGHSFYVHGDMHGDMSAGAPVVAPKPKKPKKLTPEQRVASGDFSGLTRVGEQLGANEGGIFQDEAGNQYYVKVQKSLEHAQNERLASALYRATGVDVPEVHRGSGAPGLSGEYQTASRLVPDTQVDLRSRVDSNDTAYLAAVHEGFAVDAWLANWDVAGENPAGGWDNIVSANGQPWRIDMGGALLFRGLGGPKGDAFGPVVTEWDKFRDAHSSRASAHVFRSIAPEAMAASATRVQKITPAQIRKAVADAGMDPHIADILIERRKDLLSRVGVKAKGPGKPKVKSSKDFLADAYQGHLASTAVRVRQSDWAYGTPWRGAFSDYQDGAYTPINLALIKSKGDLSHSEVYETDRARIQTMDEAFVQESAPLTHDVIVYRGERNPSRNFPQGTWSLVGGMEGMTWVFPAFGSTSTTEATARDFAKGHTSGPGKQPTVMRIRVPKGTPAIELDNLGENEILLPRGLRYRIVNDRGVINGVRHLDVMVEVVPK